MRLSILFALIAHLAVAQSYEDYNFGYYFTHDGVKVNGMICHKVFAHMSDKPDNWILFKPNPNADRQKLTTEDIESFVIERRDQNNMVKDSFAIVKNFTINSFASFPEDFARVIVAGPISIYQHSTTMSNNGFTSIVKFTLLGKNGVINKVTKSYLKHNYKTLFEGDTELIKKIESKQLTAGDIETIAREYNAWFESK